MPERFADWQPNDRPGKSTALLLRVLSDAILLPHVWFTYVDHLGVPHTQKNCENYLGCLRDYCLCLGLKCMRLAARDGLPAVMFDLAAIYSGALDSE